MKGILLVNFLLLISSTSIAQVVTTQFGPIQGTTNGTIAEFLGIPFAKPPVNTLRWQAPQDPDSWASVLSTTSFPPVCPQKNFQQGGGSDTIIGNEDCLYLNVWTPQVGVGTRPVLVFIHGGGNQQGSSSEENGGTQMFFGKNMAERGDAVVVTIQYRLGPLGFLVHPGLEPENANSVSGNYAVLDQLLALQWVQNNIANFGGDPSKVMVFGESAGGLDVGNLLTTPLAAGLFQRACIESAVPVVGAYADSKINGIAFVDSFTTVGTDVQRIAYMRTLPSDSIVQYETSPISGGVLGLQWKAVIDSVVFFDTPMAVFQSGNFNHVPLIIGSNSEEMSLSAPSTVFPFMVTALISASVPSGLQAQATALYPPGSTNNEAKASYIGLLTDGQFTAPVRRTAQCISQNQNEPVWRYFFTHKHTVPLLQPLGSYHGMELFYVFNNWENATLGAGPLFDPQDDSVQQSMLHYWVNFATTGDPNGAGLTTWPNYQSATDCYLEIKATPNGNQCGLRTAESDLWDAAISYVPCTSSIGLDEESLNNTIQLYPNPTSGMFTLDLNNGNSFSIIGVYDLTGNEISVKQNGSHVDLSNCSPGMYHLLIDKNGVIARLKVVKAAE